MADGASEGERKLRKDDSVTPQRSALMARVRGKNTTPEMLVRRAAHALGYRFRLHPKQLPGRPDLVFPSRRKAIFVHGCFWHRHLGCRMASMPKTRAEFWSTKFEQNVRRDAAAIEALESTGWKVLVIWECETRDEAGLRRTLDKFLA
ncbi:MAG TPA: very short patch repair endonuclease [Lichenihabitans sp.]|jgi:DNA mismatch endonuclease (patch repair protein)|nr:very short patch repair endonuclease [Lichenihabitans sp.]